MKYEDPGRIEKVGVENLRGMSEFDPTVRTREYGNMERPNYVAEEYYADENHYANFILFDNMKNGWVRNATALHFLYSRVGAARGSKSITVQDCVSRGLHDNIQAPLTARFWKNINIGWAGANTVFWNCEGYFLVQKPPTAQNFSFGHIGVDAVVFNIPLQDPTKDGGYIESLDGHVMPRSLYLMQLRERLCDAAVRNIAASSQLV